MNFFKLYLQVGKDLKDIKVNLQSFFLKSGDERNNLITLIPKDSNIPLINIKSNQIFVTLDRLNIYYNISVLNHFIDMAQSSMEKVLHLTNTIKRRQEVLFPPPTESITVSKKGKDKHVFYNIYIYIYFLIFISV